MHYGNEVLSTVRFVDPVLSTVRFVDPGHSWLRVPKSVCKSISFHPSSYSYVCSEFYYLEEDCDAPMFKQAWCGLDNSVIEREEYQEDCFVRQLARVT